MKIVAAAGLALALGIGTAAAQTTSPGASGAQKMSQVECQQIWSKLDTSKAGSVSQSQATSYVTDFSKADANSDGRLSSTEFTSACNSGLVRQSAATGSGSGSGSGSMSK